MIEASTQFMVGRLSTESGEFNSFNLDGISETTGSQLCACSAETIPFLSRRLCPGSQGNESIQPQLGQTQICRHLLAAGGLARSSKSPALCLGRQASTLLGHQR